MQWENLTSTELKRAASGERICVVNFSAIEYHGGHLPIGTDMLMGHRLACLAAEREPAVVFPPYYFGKVFEATHQPGAVAIKPSLLLTLARNVFDEIARNGFSKILLYNSHGGNTHFLNFLVQCALEEDASYTLYMNRHFIIPELAKEHDAICPIPSHEHAGEIETSVMMALFPELVREDHLPHDPGQPRGKLDQLPDLATSVQWFSDFPDHYAGDATLASRAKGEKLVELYVRSLATQIAAVTSDATTPELITIFRNAARRQ